MSSVFSKWKDKLLDLGKGNPLINFKVSKSKSLEVFYPHVQDVFNKITLTNTQTNIFDIDQYLNTLKDSDPIFDKSLNGKTKLENVNKDKLVLKLASELNKNEILCFNQFSKVGQIVKNLKKVYTNALDEKGLNVLYIAFGFLKWEEKGENFYSPLVLCPIQLNGNSISFYDDNEIVTNPTLIYKLKRELNIDFPEYDVEDENSSLYQYLVDVKNKFAEKKWEVINDIHIGIFSFLKMNMYKDYDENEAEILKNSNVTKLLAIADTEKKSVFKDEDFKDYFSKGKEIFLHNVVDADSSQLEAIIKAQNNESFVLQGPPGTGKSQTITNLIAQSLYDGKKVLFVSEKMAALDVVYNKLKKVGLEDFCLELHSYKTNKKDVIDSLCKVLNKNKRILSDTAKAEIEELISNKNKLDEYCTNLHQKIESINYTPYEIINELESLKDFKSFDYVIKNKNNYNENLLNEAVKEIEKFSLESKAFDYDYRKSFWYGYQNSDMTYESIHNLKENLSHSNNFVNQILDIASELNSNLDLKINNLYDVFYYKKVLEQINKMSFFDNNFFKKSNLNELVFNLKVFNSTMDENVELKKQIDNVFSKEIYSLESKKLYLEFKNKYKSFFRIFNLGYKKKFKMLKQYQTNDSFKLNYKSAIKVLFMISKVKDNLGLLKTTLAKIHKLMSSSFDDSELSSWKNFETQLNELNSIITSDIEPLKNIDKNKIKSSKNLIDNYINILNQNKNVFENLKMVQSCFDETKFSILKTPLKELKERLTYLINNTEKINAYSILNENLNALNEKFGLLDFINKALDENSDIENLSKIFKKMFFEQFIFDYFGKNTLFRNFTKLLQDEFVNKFKIKDKLKFEISKAEIISKLDKNIPCVSDCISGSQVSILLREANKKRKQKTVRALISEITELIQLLKPCFLMSPLSVSTYLSTNECKFDIVIFDEASQIAPWDAIGSIYRASQVVIVGDSKQMPPSNFFNATEESEEYDEDDSLDFESILDLSTSAFPQTSLKWHYRSKTEDLITFSNKNFYNNELNTFPSILKDDKDMGIDFYYVQDGIFDRKSKTNLKEAQKVVELVKEHYQNYPDRSLGVVAFSVSQQDLIEDCLNEAKEKDTILQQQMAQNIAEPFFIKNLETVQGDERDTIIFSVAYAKDSDGKFILNFGPLNKKGGERRLNVAVTRAKCNVKLIASITDNDIDLGKTESVGTKLLKEYLHYARFSKEYQKEITSNTINNENFIIDEISNFLNENGYQTQKNVGYSEKKIDLVVKDKNEKYVLAIETDGNNYKNAKTTTDRDAIRQSVLENMGWHYVRIWSVEWFKNKDNEKRNLLKLLETIDLNKTVNDNETFSNFIIEDDGNKTLQSNFEVYEKFDIIKYCKENNKKIDFNEVIVDLIKSEQPINENYLLLSVMPLLKIDKISLTTRLDLGIRLKRMGKIKKCEDYYCVDETKPITMRLPKDEQSRRNINFIANAEIEAGILKIIKLNVGVDKENLVKIISSLLGFKRMNDQIKSKIEICIDDLLDDKKIIMQDEKYLIA